MLPRTLLVLPSTEAAAARQGFGENVLNCLSGVWRKRLKLSPEKDVVIGLQS